METQNKMRSDAHEPILCICAMGSQSCADFVQAASIRLHLHTIGTLKHSNSY